MNQLLEQPTQIPQTWQTEAERILELERENADLKLQLEKRVRLREDLAEALDHWAVAFDDFYTNKFNMQLLERQQFTESELLNVYRASKQAGAV